MTSESLETEVLAQCPCCASSDTHHWCYASDLLLSTTDQTYEYHRCRRCFVLFLRVRPLESEAGRAYPSDYHPYTNSQSDGDLVASGPSTRLFGRVVSRIVGSIGRLVNARRPRSHKRLGKGDVFLDFGCGSGKFLDRMRQRGCATIGMDFSPHALAAVEKHGHVALPVSDLGWSAVPLQSVDFVRMNHVLEHLYDPRDVLGHLYKKLHRGGVLHVAVPNPNAWLARAFRSNWLGLDCPRHLVLYPPTVLKGLLTEIGFGEFEIIHEPAAKDHIRTWALFLNDMGLTHVEDVNLLIRSRWLQALFAVPAACAVLARGGDRFHVIARKK